MSRDFYQLIRSYGGLSLNYKSLVESDFAAAPGAAYTPAERGDFRRIVPDRTIQTLSEAPGVIETFQASAAFLRLPSNDAAYDTNDAGDGRIFFIKNSGTGAITIQDYSGANLFILNQLIMVIAVSNSANSWDFYFQAKNIAFDNSVTMLPVTNVQDAIDTLFNTVAVSASPGFTWGRSGVVSAVAYLQNDSVPSSTTGRIVPVSSGEITTIFVVNEDPNTFMIEVLRRDPGPVFTLLATVSLTAERSKTVSLTGVSVSLGDELAVRVGSGSCKNPVAGLIIKGSV